MISYLRRQGSEFVEDELPVVPPHIDYDTVEINDMIRKADYPGASREKYGPRGNVTRMRPTNERGDPIDADPFPVRWDGRLGAYVRA